MFFDVGISHIDEIPKIHLQTEMDLEHYGNLSPLKFSSPFYEHNKAFYSVVNNSSTSGPIVSENPVIQKINTYAFEKNKGNPQYLMAFMRIPENQKQAKEFAREVATIAVEYEKHGYTPIFIFEPSQNEKGANLEKITVGQFDEYISLLFRYLKYNYSLSEKQMGILIPYPEINTPAFYRKNFYPSNFARIINSFFGMARQYYPNISGGILLDSKTYDTDDWGTGKYKSLLPYISGIQKEYITYFGVQGFPWISQDKKSRSLYVRTFLPSKIILEGADYLGTKKVWINTGTIGRKYANQVIFSPNQRVQSFNSLLSYMLYFQTRGYEPLVHIFANDNTAIIGDATDWSYSNSPKETQLLKDFISKSQNAGIHVGIYDE